MPSRVLLISANRCTTTEPVFPLGLACLNAALRQAGHQTLWLDLLINADRFAETLGGFRPDFVGKNVPTARHEQVNVWLQEIEGKDEVLIEK